MAILAVAKYYRLNVSAQQLYSTAIWSEGNLSSLIKKMARQAGLNARVKDDLRVSAWSLPVIIALKDGRVGVIQSVSGPEQDANWLVAFADDDGLLTGLNCRELENNIDCYCLLRPQQNVRDARVDEYIKPVEENWLWKIVFRNLRPYYFVILGSLFVNLLGLAGITYSMQTYDRIIPAQSYPTMWVLFSGVIVAFAFDFTLRLLRYSVIDVLGKRADLRISDKVFGHSLRVSNGYRPQSTGSFISQLKELEQIREMITSSTVVAIADLPFFFLFLFIIYLIGGIVFLVPLAGMLLMVIPGFLCQRKLATLARGAMRESSLRSAMLVETVQGLDDIKFMQAEARFQQQWLHYTATTAESSLELKHLTHKLTSWSYLIQNSVFVFVVLAGTPLAIDGQLSTGALVATSILSSRMMAPISQIAGILTRWQQTRVSVTGLDEVMKLPTDFGDGRQHVHLPMLRGDINLAQAHFRHHHNDKNRALSVSSLTINSGEKIALLGRNGAGKSSLLSAIAGLMVLESGVITLDGIRQDMIDPADLRRDIGFLSQTSRLFHGTVRENITLGAPLAGDDEIHAALRMTGAMDFINSLHDGLEHVILEGGNGLSGGQKQALLLARLVIRDPAIVLLDEPTASFDDVSERQFIENMRPWLANKTVVVSTHRKQILELVDRIVVIANGQVAVDKPKSMIMESI